MPSSSSTDRASGMRRRACGWVGSANAGSSSSSIAFSVAERRTRSRRSWGTSRPSATSAMSSRSTRTRCCLPVRRPSSWAHWPIRSIGRCTTRRARVVRGYGILQPRVGVSLPSAHRSRFAAIQSGQPGVDPYTTAVSDVYQDLFHEGSFTGKGIYDVDAFERATRGRFPENRLLSHDLIEGNYARAGLVTDITVYDDYPTRYLTWTRRKHRWVRGDWQLLQWITRWVPGPAGSEPNRLSLLSRWKLFDNLRRSVVEIAL